MRDALRLKFCLAHKQQAHSYLIPFFTKQHAIVNNQQCERPLTRINEEPIYILGHSHVRNKTFYLSDQTAEELFSTLLNSGLNPYQKNLKLVLICCRSGLKIFERSFAEQLLECFYHRLGDIEWRHREVEGTNPVIQAPKTLISISDLEMWTINNKDYQAYRKMEGDDSPWIEKHAKPAMRKDFQFFPKSHEFIRHHIAVECCDELSIPDCK